MALTDQLISYWKLDEASGNAVDAHGSSPLTDVNGVGSAAGKIGTARDFEADSSQSLTAADSPALSTGDIDFTVACWVMLESVGADRVIAAKRSSSTVSEWVLRYGTSSQRFQILVHDSGGTQIGAATASNFGALSVGVWYYVVAWHDSVNNQVGISVNGTVNTAATTGAPSDTAGVFRVGAMNVSAVNFWDGLIDALGFWKRVLTSQERSDLYNSGNGLAYPFPSLQTLSPPAIASAAQLYAPTVTLGPVQLGAPVIDSTLQPFAPILTPGPVNLAAPFLAGASAVYAPSVALAALPAVYAEGSDALYLRAVPGDAAYGTATASDSEG